MIYSTLKQTLASLHANNRFILPYNQMVDLGLQDEATVDKATWDAYDWEVTDAAVLEDLDLTDTATVLPSGFEWDEGVVRQVNVASPKPDWGVLVANQVKT